MVPFDYDATGMSADNTFEPFPAAEYKLQIINENEKVTKNSDPMVSLTLEVADGPYKGRKVWHNVVFIPKGKPGAGICLHFLKTIGEPHEGELVGIDPLAWIMKTFDAKVIIEKGLDGIERNKIAYIKSNNPKDISASTGPVNDNDVPF